MSLYDGWILTFILIGMIMIFVSFLFGKVERITYRERTEKEQTKQDRQIDYEEVNRKIVELNEYGEYLKSELDQKHRELLFLYQMISDKEKEMKRMTVNLARDEVQPTKQQEVDKNSLEELDLRAEVIKMNQLGMKRSDIAKKLKIDQGQVDLIINLYQ